MSTAIAVSRPPSDVSTTTPLEFCQRRTLPTPRCSTSSGESSKIASDKQLIDLEARIESAIRERDEQWRRHERAQIQFLQTETSAMLKALHAEVARLGDELREARRKLAMGEAEEAEEGRVAELERAIREKDAYTRNLEQKVTATIRKLQEQIHVQSDRIRQLNDELNDRNQTVTHLSQQLRAIRLREAMATSQHRRRASAATTNASSPIVSPSSPHRIFPPVSSGLLSASVAVTYPGSGAARTRSASAMRSPTMPN